MWGPYFSRKVLFSFFVICQLYLIEHHLLVNRGAHVENHTYFLNPLELYSTYQTHKKQLINGQKCPQIWTSPLCKSCYICSESADTAVRDCKKASTNRRQSLSETASNTIKSGRLKQWRSKIEKGSPVPFRRYSFSWYVNLTWLPLGKLCTWSTFSRLARDWIFEVK